MADGEESRGTRVGQQRVRLLFPLRLCAHKGTEPQRGTVVGGTQRNRRMGSMRIKSAQ